MTTLFPSSNPARVSQRILRSLGRPHGDHIVSTTRSSALPLGTGRESSPAGPWQLALQVTAREGQRWPRRAVPVRVIRTPADATEPARELSPPVRRANVSSMIYRGELTVATRGRGTYDITRDVVRIVAASGATEGLATIWIAHTSASLIVCENADPAVRSDLEAFVARLVPDGDKLFRHDAEGDDDMPAHVRSVLTQTSIGVPIARGELVLGTWQGLYLWEHRTSPHERRLTISVIGE
jgi:secondary thiamine-phosphate synthase enzyme